MTDKVLNDYYAKRKDMYMSLVSNCTSVPEVLLKIEIYGKKWNQWDWMLLFSCIINSIHSDAVLRPSKTGAFASECLLYKDIVDTISNTDMLDKVITSKLVVLSIIYAVNSPSLRFSSLNLRQELCSLLARIFKKFPDMWTLSWMQAKYHDTASKKWLKYHRLRSTVYASPHKQDRVYYNSKLYYNDFMQLYLPHSLRKKEDEEKDILQES